MSSNYEPHFEDFKKKLSEATSRTLHAIGIFVTGETQVRCPVKTGNLRGSYTHEINEKESSVTIGTPVEYGPHVELGTYKMKAQPHLRPAVEKNISRIENIVRENLNVG